MNGADAYREERERPQAEGDRGPDEHVAAGAAVRPAGAEEIATERGKPDGPDKHQRESEGSAREPHDVARAPVGSLPAEGVGRTVNQRAPEPERGSGVDAAADEGPDGDDEPVAHRIVEQRASDRAREDAGDPGKPREREERLLPRVGRRVGIVAERGEDRARRLEHQHRAQEPFPVEPGLLRTRAHGSTQRRPLARGGCCAGTGR